jgi:hypothetical protein
VSSALTAVLNVSLTNFIVPALGEISLFAFSTVAVMVIYKDV